MNAKHLAASLVLLAACADPDAPKPVASRESAARPSMPAPATTPQAQPAADPHKTPMSSPHAGTAKRVEFTFAVPAGWIAETPGQFRKLQFRLPRQATDTDDVAVWVSTAGGSREANLTRWHGEFAQPDGKETKDVAKTLTRKVGSLEMFEYDVSGTCVATSPMGQGGGAPKENWRQIVTSFGEGPEQWFVKIRGPIASVAHWEASYRQFVDSAKPSS
jgi:hypothetical protein